MRRRSRGTTGVRRSRRISTREGVLSRYSSRASSPEEPNSKPGDREDLNAQQPEEGGSSNALEGGTFQLPNHPPVRLNLEVKTFEEGNFRNFVRELSVVNTRRIPNSLVLPETSANIMA